MKKIKCIITEDEPLAVNVLKNYIQRVPYLELMAVFKEAFSTEKYLQKEKIDLIFLDIHLPQLKGLDFLRTLRYPPVVIITTAYHQYALEGFELSVADYLMKPIAFDRFASAVNKATKLIDVSATFQSEKKENSIFLTINRKKVRILLDDILFIESNREYVTIHTSTSKYISKISTTELEAMLSDTNFKRIHRSFIVAVNKIETYTKENVEIKGIIIPIGKNYKRGFTI
ncbi:MAG: response regulator transcription factor [Sediminibacterium sp. Gen4]|jgi:two-component system, LytTR family, response regulator|uniref:LytR/AlgR family response regulator transcription factor n=1 Tax=unclassified Sediminibacterium TaxID=2635961 RepID=UPI0015C00792|nr:MULTISPECIES: response regulator transcription factor [unclassified Sediminibacterium]MBW0156159.1 response regulator transcription factor [Candidatus Methylopumilus sp.]MBW0164241.1 response regulator transcription factor [Sediminibacterium sp.]NWK65467.1 response regulator transcription factor [Sediminibacterium sp. Gen4]